MQKLIIFAMALLLCCSSVENRQDTMTGEEYYTPSPLIVGAGPGYVPPPERTIVVDSGTDGGIDLAYCHDQFDNVCMPECFKLASGTRRSCFDRCEYLYRVCAGCYGDMPNE